MSVVKLDENIKKAKQDFFSKHGRLPTHLRIHPNVFKPLEKWGPTKHFRFGPSGQPLSYRQMEIVKDEKQISFEVSERAYD